MTTLSSAAGLLAQLDHTDSRIQAAALARIYPVVDTFWSEIQDSLLAIEGKLKKTTNLPLLK